MKKSLLIMLTLGLASCTTYKYARNVKVVSFDDTVTRGKSIGNIRGEDCTWQVMGYTLGGQPTLDRAFANARDGAGHFKSGFGGARNVNENSLRYITKVGTEYSGFNVGVIAKKCLVVTGIGYR